MVVELVCMEAQDKWTKLDCVYIVCVCGYVYIYMCCWSCGCVGVWVVGMLSVL